MPGRGKNPSPFFGLVDGTLVESAALVKVLFKNWLDPDFREVKDRS